MRLAARRWCAVHEVDLPAGLQGVYIMEGDMILLDRRLSDVERRCVLAHEISHARHRDGGCQCDRWTERRANIEASAMLIRPMEYAMAESIYEGNVMGIARELGVMPWVVDAYRERLHDDPCLIVQ